MKLLFDQNLASGLVRRLADLWPGSAHVRDLGLKTAVDPAIWSYAAANDFVIVTKDSDFHHRSVVSGHPPKVIWVQLGNCSTRVVETTLRRHHRELLDFHRDNARSFLVLTTSPD